MDDLKPCPFCGGKADATNYVIEASVVCQTCKATINREHGQHDDNGLPEAIAAWNVRADLLDAANARIAELEAERDEARRRRDEWRKKADGYDAVRLALREKVGAPWPPNLSRAMWAGIAADEKKRADDAEIAVDAAHARIAVLEDKLELERALSDGAHRKARNARAEALEEAAKVADHFRDSCGECHWPEEAVIVGGNVANDIAAAIRALKGDKNENG